MGDEQRQSRVIAAASLVLFLDENHCRNPHLILTIEQFGALCEKHLDHFPPGTEDVVWLAEVGRRGWCLLTTDARIRTNYLEREAVRREGVRMFYFSRNNLGGREMATALAKALPSIVRIVSSQPAPFTASISKAGDVHLRNIF